MVKSLMRLRKHKRWQVYAQNIEQHFSYIICEHRFFWMAEMCADLRRLRKGWFYDIQCRAHCKFCADKVRSNAD